MAKSVIGIDIGGTKINGILLEGGKILNELTIVTPKTLFEFERNLFKLVDFLSAKRKIWGIGVGSAGHANPATGIVRLSSNIKFKAELNLVKFLKSRYHVPVKVDNDANCFTRAEMLLGQGKNLSNFLGVILGTGVGGGIVVNKKLYRGKDNKGAEFGSMVMDGGYLEKSYQKARDANNYKLLGQITGRAFVSLINIFAPEALILGGGVSLNMGNKFLPFAKKEMKKFFPGGKGQTKILVSKLKYPGALGAALLFR